MCHSSCVCTVSLSSGRVVGGRAGADFVLTGTGAMPVTATPFTRENPRLDGAVTEVTGCRRHSGGLTPRQRAWTQAQAGGEEPSSTQGPQELGKLLDFSTPQAPFSPQNRDDSGTDLMGTVGTTA